MTYRQIQLAKRLQGEQEERNARFHVENARTPEPSVGHTERHARERSHAPHRIGMAQHENLPVSSTRTRKCKLAAQVTSEPPTREGADFRATRDLACDQIDKAVHSNG